MAAFHSAPLVCSASAKLLPLSAKRGSSSCDQARPFSVKSSVTDVISALSRKTSFSKLDRGLRLMPSRSAHVFKLSRYGLRISAQFESSDPAQRMSNVREPGDAIGRVIEIGFRKTLLFAFSGFPPRYFRTLEEFITAIIAGYIEGFSLLALKFETLRCAVVSGDAKIDDWIRLDENEADLRDTMMLLVYMTLRHMDFVPPSKKGWSRPTIDDNKGLDYMVADVARLYRRGKSLEEVLEEPQIMQKPGEEPIVGEERYVRKMYLHTIYTTLSLLAPRQLQ
mmetsp:Transcript_23425/g.40298  ORF Transcript_23425/g.40298 Transcript_23425/m.40298 type:complete len:280 (-) Transcript_23425:45-884(-)